MTSFRPRVQCSATANATGVQCRQWAVHGTTVCRTHGGLAPQVRKAAERNVQAAKIDKAMAKYATPRDDVTPSVALVEELKRAAGLVVWLEERLRSSDQPLGSVEWERLGSERDRLSRLATDLAKLGIEQSLIESQVVGLRDAEMRRANDTATRIAAAVLRRLGVVAGAEEMRTVALRLQLDTTAKIQARDARGLDELPDFLIELVDQSTEVRDRKHRGEVTELARRVAELEAAAADREAEIQSLRDQLYEGGRRRLALPAAEPTPPIEEQLEQAAEESDVLEPDEVFRPVRRRGGSSVLSHFEQAKASGRWSG